MMARLVCHTSLRYQAPTVPTVSWKAEDETIRLISDIGNRSSLDVCGNGSRRRLREFARAVAHQAEEGGMAGRAGRDQCAVHDMRTIVIQRLPGEIGEQTAGFVHQKVGGRKVPVVAAGR